MEFFTLRDFNDLSLIDKEAEVESFAELIDNFRINSTIVSLYAYSNFYVEMYWTARMNSIQTIKAITSDQTYSKYLDSYIDEAIIVDLLT